MASKLMSILLDISEKSSKESIKSKIEEIITMLESMLSCNGDEETIRRGKDMVQDSLWELLSKICEEESSLYEETLESVNYYLFN